MCLHKLCFTAEQTIQPETYFIFKIKLHNALRNPTDGSRSPAVCISTIVLWMFCHI